MLTTHSQDVAEEDGRSRERLLRLLARHVTDQIYREPSAARALLVQWAEQLATFPEEDGELTVALLQARGNLANQEHQYQEAAELLDIALKRAADTGSRAQRVGVAADLIGPLLNLGQVREAASLLDVTRESVTRAPTVHDWWLLTREGFLHLNWSDLDEALRSFTLARQQRPALDPGRDSVKDAYYAGLLDAGLGRVYSLGGEPDRSIAAYENVLTRCAAFGMRGRLVYHTLDLGCALMDANRRAEAEERFAETIALAGPLDKHALAAASANLGYYAMADGRTGVARRRFDEAEHHYRTGGQSAESDLGKVYLWRAQLADALGEDDACLAALTTSLELAGAGGGREQLALVCREISDFYKRRGDFEEAYDYRVLYEGFEAEARDALSAQRLGEVELRHEVEQRRQEGEVMRLRAARLQLKALRAQMNPHFIFNALNSIQEFITSQQSTEAAVHLAHFARLMRQSLDYSERETITLEEEVDFLRNYLDLNRSLRFKDAFTYEIEVDDDLEDDLIGLPAMLVQPYVENALEHGVRVVSDGHVRVSFASPEGDDSQLLITVEDNGQGRARAAATRGGASGHASAPHRSMGTAITRHRLELLNQSRDTEAAVVYEDLTRADGSAAGTRVLISLPILWLT